MAHFRAFVYRKKMIWISKYSKNRVYNIIAFWYFLIYEINYCDFRMSRLVKFTYCFIKIRKRIELRDKLE